jgi:hypothetical protein
MVRETTVIKPLIEELCAVQRYRFADFTVSRFEAFDITVHRGRRAFMVIPTIKTLKHKAMTGHLKNQSNFHIVRLSCGL